MKVPTPHAVLPAGRSAVRGGLKKLILYDPGGVRRSPSEEPISYFLSCESFKTNTIRMTHLFFYRFAIAVETIGLGLVAIFHFQSSATHATPAKFLSQWRLRAPASFMTHGHGSKLLNLREL